MANDFVLVTDSSCDLPPEYLAQKGIPDKQLFFSIGDDTWRCNEMSSKEFYKRIREGAMPVTSQVNVDDFLEVFGEIAASGKDVLYLAFSSGLSGTCNSGAIAAEEIGKKYPERKVLVIDTLCASMGQGLMVYKAQELKEQGKTIEEVAGWVREHIPHVAHYVLADDLYHLHRGGRVSKTSAVVGQMLGIKPIIKVNDEGKLVVHDKVRGRKPAIEKCISHMLGAVGNVENDICMISHADCEEDARYAAQLIRERTGIENFMIYTIGPVIGSHTGVGTIAMFLMGEHR